MSRRSSALVDFDPVEESDSAASEPDAHDRPPPRPLPLEPRFGGAGPVVVRAEPDERADHDDDAARQLPPIDPYGVGSLEQRRAALGLRMGHALWSELYNIQVPHVEPGEQHRLMTARLHGPAIVRAFVEWFDVALVPQGVPHRIVLPGDLAFFHRGSGQGAGHQRFRLSTPAQRIGVRRTTLRPGVEMWTAYEGPGAVALAAPALVAASLATGHVACTELALLWARGEVSIMRTRGEVDSRSPNLHRDDCVHLRGPAEHVVWTPVSPILASSTVHPPRSAVWRLIAFVDGRTLDAEVTFDGELDHLAHAVRERALAGEVLDPEVPGWRDHR
ncbi:hypothetical protein JCM8208_007511 [Rhodotorula glutinis]